MTFEKLYSTHLEEERCIQIYLPDDDGDTEARSRCYSVVYLLDGQWRGGLTWEVIQHLHRSGVIAPQILVCVHTDEHRFRDLTPTSSLLDWRGNRCESFADSGRSEVFLAYMETELIPFIESRYSTNAHRTVIGHSLGGLAVSASLLRQPHLFQALIALDASLWWDGGCMIQRLDAPELPVDVGSLQRRFFCAYANYPTNEPSGLAVLARSNRDFIVKLCERMSDTLAIGEEAFEHENHESIFLPGLLAGLRWVFDDERRCE